MSDETKPPVEEQDECHCGHWRVNHQSEVGCLVAYCSCKNFTLRERARAPAVPPPARGEGEWSKSTEAERYVREQMGLNPEDQDGNWTVGHLETFAMLHWARRAAADKCAKHGRSNCFAEDCARELVSVLKAKLSQSPSPAAPTPGAGREVAAELLETAWGVIANASGGNWDSKENHPDWRGAAERWRDDYFAWLKASKTPAAPPQSAGAGEPYRNRHCLLCGADATVWTPTCQSCSVKLGPAPSPTAEPALGDVIEVLWTMTDFVEALMPLAKMKRTPPWDLEIKNAREVLQRLRTRAAAPRPEGGK